MFCVALGKSAVAEITCKGMIKKLDFGDDSLKGKF